MMKETNIHSQVTSTIAGDDGEAMAKSEGYVAENGFVATDPTHFEKTYHDKQLLSVRLSSLTVRKKLLLASNASQKEL